MMRTLNGTYPPRPLASMLVLCWMMFGFAHGQNAAPVTRDFFSFMNDYQADKLAPLLAEDFEWRRTYGTATHSKTSFLTTYLPNSKACNGKYKVLKIISDHEPSQFLVEDQSDYFKYFDIDCPTWILTIATEGNLIKQVTVDTTASYRRYLADMRRESPPFNAWLQATYPDETKEDRYQQAGLLTRRLKEYARQRAKR